MKKIVALVMAGVMALTLASCGNSGKETEQKELSSQLDAISGKLDDVIASLENAQGTGAGTQGGESAEIPAEGEPVTDASGETVTDASGEAVTEAPAGTTSGGSSSSSSKTPAASTDYTKNDPSTWTTAQIVDYYKKAAAATEKAGCKSKQTMTLENLNGGSGATGALINLVGGAAKSALSKNSTEFDGITGGYEKLTASDLKSASAKKSGNYVIINMTPKDQTDGVNGKYDEGTVGHVVSVLDGVDTAIKETGLSVDYSDGTIKLLYNNAYAKNIKINMNTGKIESGTWGHTVNATIDNVKVAIFTLKGASAVIKFTVTMPA